MLKKTLSAGLLFLMICALAACGTTGQQDAGTPDISENSSYESVEGTQIKMITENAEVVITLNGSRAAADLAAMLPLDLTLIERNSFAKGMTLPERLSSSEATTREYEIGDFGYPSSFKVDFVGKPYEGACYYRITRCPICAYCERLGVGELMPLLCELDEVMIGLQHGVLHREQTIASGGACCDYFIRPENNGS